MSSWHASRLSKAMAFLALALTLLGSVRPGVSGGLGASARFGSDGSAGCLDEACGCPPAAALTACCCDPESDDPSAPDGHSALAILVGGLGCTTPAPGATPASPAGPLLAEWADVVLPAIVDLSRPGTTDASAPGARSTRPPVPPPRG